VSCQIQIYTSTYIKRDSCFPGRHCCLWCTIRNTQLKVPLHTRGRLPSRSLESLRADHQRFLDAGGNLKKAKEFNNAIAEPFFSIPLQNVRGSYLCGTNCFTIPTIFIGLHSWPSPISWYFQPPVHPARRSMPRT